MTVFFFFFFHQLKLKCSLGTALKTSNRVISSHQLTLAEACDSGKFTTSGQCCSLCPAGFQVEAECGKEDTKCAPCPQGEQLSSEVSHHKQRIFYLPLFSVQKMA